MAALPGTGIGWIQNTGVSCGSPLWAHWPTLLHCLPLLSQAISMELDCKWSNWDFKRCFYGILPLHQAAEHVVQQCSTKGKNQIETDGYEPCSIVHNCCKLEAMQTLLCTSSAWILWGGPPWHHDESDKQAGSTVVCVALVSHHKMIKLQWQSLDKAVVTLEGMHKQGLWSERTSASW